MPRKSLSTTTSNGKKTSKKNGRPTKWKEIYVAVGYEVMRMGATVAGLAKVLKVDNQTVENWRATYPDFFEAVLRGRREHDSGEVEIGLAKRAKGYTYEEVSVEGIVLLGKGEDGQYYVEQKEQSIVDGKKVVNTKLVAGMRRKVTVRHIPADVHAAMAWLTNRQPEEWKNVQRQIVEGEIKHNHVHEIILDLANLNRGELEQFRFLNDKATATGTDGNAGPDRLGPGESQLVPFRKAALALRRD